ncbi:MAG TPA: CRISPR system precrRNA processing endoribonuclease RAMP protein Cas6 [Myxococcota bacterium]|nr:CRISPR system precrRNA processing endoribonuclease RAMP protein Cas6 [Myxococcota bacterium]HRY96623.1 CRISPR system precrRNA processing endoribonuclease RAMP protein Cas6 [Myxococcota bacterium]HSA21418.1 CRISPR system precrRNA processing endoribonuclease RAMP protein Cas6 [Myxococcota bacterium]
MLATRATGTKRARGRATEIPPLPLTRLVLRFAATADTRIQVNPGDRFHSRLGAHLRRLVCGLPEQDCGRCLALHACAFGSLFQTPGPVGAVGAHGDHAPHPFVAGLPPAALELGRGEEVDVPFTCVGQPALHLPMALLAIRRMDDAAQGSDGPQYWPLRLDAAWQLLPDGAERRVLDRDREAPIELAPPAPYTPGTGGRRKSATLRVRLVTPLALRERGKLVEKAPSLYQLVLAAVRRVGQLLTAHTDLPALPARVAAVDLADEAELLEALVRKVCWLRDSRRQGQAVPHEGLVGELVYGSCPPAARDWLELGALLHLGRGTALGLGRIEVDQEDA